MVVYDKDEISSASSAEKISKSNVTKVIYLEGGIQSWIENNLPLVEKTLQIIKSNLIYKEFI